MTPYRYKEGQTVAFFDYFNRVVTGVIVMIDEEIEGEVYRYVVRLNASNHLYHLRFGENIICPLPDAGYEA